MSLAKRVGYVKGNRTRKINYFLVDKPSGLGLALFPMKKPTKDELKRVMSMLGKKGGKVKSPRKTAAARLNATRPRKKKIAA